MICFPLVNFSSLPPENIILKAPIIMAITAKGVPNLQRKVVMVTKHDNSVSQTIGFGNCWALATKGNIITRDINKTK